jgi:hypothetical protein
MQANLNLPGAYSLLPPVKIHFLTISYLLFDEIMDSFLEFEQINII